jgi:hypothetical protein
VRANGNNKPNRIKRLKKVTIPMSALQALPENRARAAATIAEDPGRSPPEIRAATINPCDVPAQRPLAPHGGQAGSAKTLSDETSA